MDTEKNVLSIPEMDMLSLLNERHNALGIRAAELDADERVLSFAHNSFLAHLKTVYNFDPEKDTIGPNGRIIRGTVES